jgi:hypothetical protein
MRHLIRQCWRRGSYLRSETEDSWMTCGCSKMGHPHTSLLRCFERTISRPLAHQHLRHHCHGHHVVLTLPPQTIRCGVLSRFAQSCGRRLSHNYSTNAPTYVTEDMEAHAFVCPASRCTYGSTGHVTKTYVIPINYD